MNYSLLTADQNLGFCSFSYYIKNMSKYELHVGKSSYHLTLVGEGVYHNFELSRNCTNAECGYVYVNIYDWERLFAAIPELISEFCEKCIRPKGKRFFGEKDWHCHIDDSLKGKIAVTLDCGTKVTCKAAPAP